MTDTPEKKMSLLQQLYTRCMEWIQTPAGIWVLFLTAVAESSFFPIPPDVFLLALCIASPQKSLKYAFICTAGSVIGGAIGYGLGLGFMDTVGQPILDMYDLHEKYGTVQALYQQYDALAIGAAAFTPLPYKLFTITSGAFHINFLTFFLVSIAARGARFFLVAGLIYKFGASVQSFINKYFNILSVAFFLLLIGGFVVVKLVL